MDKTKQEPKDLFVNIWLKITLSVLPFLLTALLALFRSQMLELLKETKTHKPFLTILLITSFLTKSLHLCSRKESKGDKDEDDESHDKETIEKKMRHIFIGEVIAYVSLVILFFILTIPIILHVRCENTKKEISNPNTTKNNAHMQNITIHKKPAP